MDKTNIILLAFLIILVFYNITSKNEFEMSTNPINSDNSILLKSESQTTRPDKMSSDIDMDIYGVIDYPLIDISLCYNELDVAIIIANDILSPDKENYFFTNNKEILEKMQTKFKVHTFPKGFGTTPDSIVYIYQDNILIREIPFLGTYNNDNFNLIEFSRNEIEEIIRQELPPII